MISGCLNGGGQLRPESSDGAKALLQAVEEAYHSVPITSPLVQPQIDQLYTEWLTGTDSDKARSLLHTQYHEVEKMTNALSIKWWYLNSLLVMYIYNHDPEVVIVDLMQYVIPWMPIKVF